MSSLLTRQYGGVWNIAAEYWRRYDGLGALVSSPYLHIAVIILVPTFNIWSAPGWWDLPLSVLPSIVSFTLAGFAMLIAFGNDGFKKFISDEGERQGPLLSTGAAFTHLLITQTLALIAAIISKGRPLGMLVDLGLPLNVWFACHQNIRIALVRIAWAIGFLLFLYSITSIVAVTFSLFRVTKYFNQYAGLPPEPRPTNDQTDANIMK